MRFKCATCGAEHDAADLEPSFDAPLAYYQLPQAERGARALLKQERCWITDTGDRQRRYFLRVVMPIPVHGETRPCYWGAWVEIDRQVSERVDELWDDPDQGKEPLLPATLANELGEFPGSNGLAGFLQLVDERTRPNFLVAPTVNHPLREAQATGVPVEDTIAWIMARAHG